MQHSHGSTQAPLIHEKSIKKSSSFIIIYFFPANLCECYYAKYRDDFLPLSSEMRIATVAKHAVEFRKVWRANEVFLYFSISLIASCFSDYDLTWQPPASNNLGQIELNQEAGKSRIIRKFPIHQKAFLPSSPSSPRALLTWHPLKKLSEQIYAQFYHKSRMTLVSPFRSEGSSSIALLRRSLPRKQAQEIMEEAFTSL